MTFTYILPSYPTYLCTLAGFLATTTKKWHGRWSRGNNHCLAPLPTLYHVLLPLLWNAQRLVKSFGDKSLQNPVLTNQVSVLFFSFFFCSVSFLLHGIHHWQTWFLSFSCCVSLLFHEVHYWQIWFLFFFFFFFSFFLFCAFFLCCSMKSISDFCPFFAVCCSVSVKSISDRSDFCLFFLLFFLLFVALWISLLTDLISVLFFFFFFAVFLCCSMKSITDRPDFCPLFFPFFFLLCFFVAP